MLREIWIPTATKYEIPESEFWKMSPKTMARRLPYFAGMLKQKNQSRYTEAWLHGQYVHMAISASFSKNFRYPEEPPELYPEKIEQTDKEITVNAALQFKRLAAAHNRAMEMEGSNA